MEEGFGQPRKNPLYSPGISFMPMLLIYNEQDILWRSLPSLRRFLYGVQ